MYWTIQVCQRRESIRLEFQVSTVVRWAKLPTANCQSVISLQGVVERFHFPLAAKLNLSEAWTKDSERMASAGVPATEHKFKEK